MGFNSVFKGLKVILGHLLTTKNKITSESLQNT